MKKNRLSFGFGFVIAVLLTMGFNLNLAAKSDTTEKEQPTRLESLAKLTKVIGIVENYYVDELELSEVVDKAISGLLSNLDAHSSFMDEKGYKETKIQTKGEFGGLGITVGMKNGALTVIAPIEGTPADKAGVKPNDVILRIDGNSTIETTLDEAVNKMRGEPKTPVTITIVREGEVKPFDIKIIRDIIKVESVYAKEIEDNDILYLRVTNFDQKVTSQTKKFLEANRDKKGIILDLRNNPGGLLDQAIGLANLFIDSGVIVSQKGRNESENIVYEAKKNLKISDQPMVVLINGGSASASEIVSGALQDHKRAVIVGQNSFGKGSVQVILPIDKKEKEALRLTIAKYYLPSGKTIQAVGLKPDIEVFPGKVPNSSSQFTIKEADLKKHLESELTKIDDNSSKKDKKEKESKNLITAEQINDDIQLKTAIDTIKILNLK